MPRDSLTDSSRTMVNQGGGTIPAAHKQRNKKKHTGPIDPHASKIPARRAESLFSEIHPHLYAEPTHLTLVAHIAKAHRAEVTVKSAMGAGSLFALRLPLEQGA